MDVQALKDTTVLRKRSRTKKKVSKKKVGHSKQFGSCNRFLVKGKTVFTKDLNYLLCATGKLVRIYCRKTGLLDSVFKGHSAGVNNVFINEINPLQVISTSVSGEVIFWDHSDCNIEKSFKLPYSTVSTFVNPKVSESLFCVVNNDLKGKSKILIKTSLQDPSMKETIGSISKAKVVFDSHGKYAVFLFDNELCLYNNTKQTLQKYTHDDKELTCLACHPSELKIVTGDSQGKIVIWHGLKKKDNVVCVQLHWHHSPVADCVFSADGNYIISGGDEAAMVMWQLETQEPSFVPRLGSSIKHISVSQDTKYVSVSLASNTIKVLATADIRLVSSIMGLAPFDESSNSLAYDPKTDCIVLPSATSGMLQFYDPFMDNVVDVVDVIGENAVAGVKERPVFNTQIVFVSFNTEGSWMATVEKQSDPFLKQSWKLKFWSFDDKKYTLNTSVEPVHDKKVNGLAFRPHSPDSANDIAVTTSDDGDFKVWSLFTKEAKTGVVEKTWLCQAVGCFGFDSCTSVSFSSDGSLLAVLYDDITIWDPDPLSMKSNFGSNVVTENIKQVAFGHHESSHLLIGNTEKHIIVWDVKSCDVQWCVEAPESYIAVDHTSKYFGAFIWNQTNRSAPLYLFDPSSPKPVVSIDNVSGGEKDIKSAIFMDRKEKNDQLENKASPWCLTGKLYFLSGDGDIMTIKDTNKKEEVKVVDIVTEKDSIDDLFKLDRVINPKIQEGRVSAECKKSGLISTMFTTPSHILPTVDIMFQGFAKSLLLTNSDDVDQDENGLSDDSETKDTNERTL